MLRILFDYKWLGICALLADARFEIKDQQEHK